MTSGPDGDFAIRRSVRPRSGTTLKNAALVTGPGSASLWCPALGLSNSRQFTSIIVENTRQIPAAMNSPAKARSVTPLASPHCSIRPPRTKPMKTPNCPRRLRLAK